MIPPFNDIGYLPPGIHPASLDEIEARFGRESEIRQVQVQSLRWLAVVVGRAKIRRFVINGSFVTDKLEPNDIDCVVLIDPEFPLDSATDAELRSELPFINLVIADQMDFQDYTESIYATDRDVVPKGMVEVVP